MNGVTSTNELETFSYDDSLVKLFTLATIFWAIVALFLGVTIAMQLANWRLNFGLEWFTFGRLRPVHTNAAIFAFAGNAIFAGIYHSTSRLLKTRMYSDLLGRIHFWGWQLIIIFGAISLMMGISHGKEYAELEWPLDIAITIIWVIFAVNFFGTMKIRREKHLYVSIWFYISTIVTVAILHIVNSIEIPVSLMKSYPIYAGVQDALVQWWYGHNAVAFFLTTPFLGLMYYYVPKAVNQPIYSYRLSIIHFWSLVFIYIWAGPHHLLYTALPDWAQTLGMVFSITLLAPSWGGMINGLLTMRGAWDRVRKEPVLKFLATGITFYGMSTFEGPLLSIKSVNLLAHYTDWIIGHVHGGTIGWNAFISAGVLYYLVPKLWKTKLFSERLANYHFWLSTIGLLLYMMSMWTAGITQGLMWRAININGKLVYPDFIETVSRIIGMYHIRAIGGVFVLAGFILMLINFFKTIKSSPKDQSVEVFQAPPLKKDGINKEKGHRRLEGLPAIFTVLSIVAILVGSAIEILPSFMANDFVEKNPKVKPYSPLELAGRDIYISEGCYLCHSQMIRKSAMEVLRYGKVSEASEFVYDRPFQWGSRRIGPDLARVGGKYPDLWHFRHMVDPRAITPKSIMPSYPWLTRKNIDYKVILKKMRVMKSLGVPYSKEEINESVRNAKKQAKKIITVLNDEGKIPLSMKDKEIIALIAYLQRIGTDLGSEQ